jgi:hypothetical protein
MKSRLAFSALAWAMVSTSSVADPATHQLTLFPVDTVQSDCGGHDSGGNLICVDACLMRSSLKRVGSYAADDSISFNLTFQVPKGISDSGLVTRSFNFSLADSKANSTTHLNGVKCRNIRLISLKAECTPDSSGRPHCKQFTKIRVMNLSRKLVPVPAVLFGD